MYKVTEETEETEVTEATISFENMLTDHYIGELPEEFTKPVTYIVQRDGIWEIRKNEIGIFSRHLVKCEIHGLSNLIDETDFDQLYVPKIPIAILGQAVSFFRHIFNTTGCESFIDVLYNTEEEQYYAFCPEQKVSPAGVTWEIPKKEDMPDGIKVLELHSHCDMGSFFSGTDDADEKADQYYGVVGKLDNFMPKISFRLVLGGQEYEINVEDIFDLDGDVYHSKFPEEWTDKVTKGINRVVQYSTKAYPHYSGYSGYGKLYHPQTPASLPQNLQEDLWSEEDYLAEDETLELTEDEYAIYSQYLKDYYKEDSQKEENCKDFIEDMEEDVTIQKEIYNYHMDMGRRQNESARI